MKLGLNIFSLSCRGIIWGGVKRKDESRHSLPGLLHCGQILNHLRQQGRSQRERMNQDTFFHFTESISVTHFCTLNPDFWLLTLTSSPQPSVNCPVSITINQVRPCVTASWNFFLIGKTKVKAIVFLVSLEERQCQSILKLLHNCTQNDMLTC